MLSQTERTEAGGETSHHELYKLLNLNLGKFFVAGADASNSL